VGHMVYVGESGCFWVHLQVVRALSGTRVHTSGGFGAVYCGDQFLVRVYVLLCTCVVISSSFSDINAQECITMSPTAVFVGLVGEEVEFSEGRYLGETASQYPIYSCAWICFTDCTYGIGFHCEWR